MSPTVVPAKHKNCAQGEHKLDQIKAQPAGPITRYQQHQHIDHQQHSHKPTGACNRPPPEQVATRVHQLLLNGGTHDRAQIRHIIGQLNQQERKEVHRILETKHALHIAVPKQDPVSVPKSNPIDIPRLSKSCTGMYEAMKGGFTGIGTDEKKIFRILHDKSPAEIQKIKELYHEHYGRDLVRDLRAELKDNQKFLNALAVTLKGEKLASVSAIIRLETSLPGPDKKLIENVMQSLTPEERKSLRKFYLETYAEKIETSIEKAFPKKGSTESLLLLLKPERDVEKVAQIQKILELPPALAKEELISFLRMTSPQDLKTLEKAFQAHTDKSMQVEVEKILKGAEKHEALALLSGDLVTAHADRLQQAKHDSQKLSDALVSICEGKDRSHMQLVLHKYQEKYGQELIKEIVDLQKVEPMLAKTQLYVARHGQIEPLQQIIFAIHDAKDPAGSTVKVLETFNESTLNEVSLRFAEAFQVPLEQKLVENLHKAERFEVRIALQGQINSLEEKVWQAQALHSFERELKSSTAKAFDKISIHGKVYDMTMERMNRLYQQSLVEERILKEEEGLLSRLVGYSRADLKIYRRAKLRFIKTASRALGVTTTLLLLLLGSLVGVHLGLAILGAGATGYGTSRIVENLMLRAGRERLDLIEELKRKRRLGTRRGKPKVDHSRVSRPGFRRLKTNRL